MDPAQRKMWERAITAAETLSWWLPVSVVLAAGLLGLIIRG